MSLSAEEITAGVNAVVRLVVALLPVSMKRLNVTYEDEFRVAADRLSIAAIIASWLVTACGSILVRAQVIGLAFKPWSVLVLMAFGLVTPAVVLFGVRYSRIHGYLNIAIVYTVATVLDVGFVHWSADITYVLTRHPLP